MLDPLLSIGNAASHLGAENAVVAGLLLGADGNVDEAGVVRFIGHGHPQVEGRRSIVIRAVVFGQLQAKLAQRVVHVVGAAVVLLGCLLFRQHPKSLVLSAPS